MNLNFIELLTIIIIFIILYLLYYIYFIIIIIIIIITKNEFGYLYSIPENYAHNFVFSPRVY